MFATTPVPNEPVTPNRIQAGLIAAGWSGQIPPAGFVNAPSLLTSLYPGQKVAVVVIAQGPDRDTLLRGVTANVQISSKSHGTSAELNLHSGPARQLKAQGADFALMAIKSAGVAANEIKRMEKSTALSTCAIILPRWTVPSSSEREEVLIEVSLSASAWVGEIPAIKATIRPTADWLTESLPTGEELGRIMTRQHADVAPGQLLTWLRTAVSLGHLNQSAANSFYGIAYQHNHAARDAAVALYPQLDAKTQKALLHVLRLAGQDLAALFPSLPAPVVASLKTVVPIKDPRNLPRFTDPVVPETVRGIGTVMDQNWAGWMATGDPSYLRALVGLLEGAPDFAAFQAWTKAQSGLKGLNAKVARGLAYQIAGWSIGSFQRTDPSVADWLNFWQKDSTVARVIRKEIATLPGNPAFRRN